MHNFFNVMLKNKSFFNKVIKLHFTITYTLYQSYNGTFQHKEQ